MKGYISSLPVSLYIHIPFCVRKCDYCAFYSRPGKEEEIEKYFSLLLWQLEEIKKEVKAPFHTVYIGGGNPGLLGWKRIGKILDSAFQYGRPKEVSIECNPENLDEDVVSLSGLVDRISIGIQSLDDEVLKTLGRRLDRKTNLRALELLSRLPFRWNADIITAIPGESVETTLSDIREISSFGPGHISFYALTFEEGTPILSRLSPIGEEKEVEFLMEGWKLLEDLGYRHYEVSNFAKKGEECLHNKVYWNLGQYIGLGPSAESALGYREMVSMRNRESIEEYLSSPDFDCENLSIEETEEAYLLTSLRTSDGIDKREYLTRFGKDFDSQYFPRLSLIPEDSFINDKESFRVTEKGLLTLDSIILSLSLAI